MHHRTSIRFALIVAVALLAGSCTTGDSTDADETPDNGAIDSGSDTVAPDGTRPYPTPPPAKEPRYGGTLTYGIEADSLNPWTPQFTALAVSGHMVMRSVFDPLALPTADLEVKGYLLEDIQPNDDYTEWTLTIREGIRFHDETPLDGDAVAANLELHRTSPVTGNYVRDIASIEADGNVVVVAMRRPWVSFPVILTGEVGYIASPSWLAQVGEDPANALEPVGTGPFVFESYVPGESFTATRNEQYWRSGLPYLDRVEFLVKRNIADRSAALLDGTANIIHTANGDEIAKFRNRLGVFGMVEAREFGETTYVLLNAGNPTSPVSDVNVRRAMAHALDYDIIKTARNGGVLEIPNGPFQPGSIGYLEDTGFPAYDPELAQQLVADWEAENGPLQITFTTTSDEFNLISAELYAQFWEAAGIDVTLETIDQSQYIGFALVGNFEAYFWRLHSGFDPDQQYQWWISDNAADYGTVATNFGRVRDDAIDEALEIIRTSADPEARRGAAERINRRFAEQVYNIWLGWAVTAIIFDPSVQDVNTAFTLPDGSPVLATGVGIGGTHQIAQIWIDE
jgi:peptide/nickel transport system substrate-binding protein